jgi:hypothetical protein
MYRLQQFSDIRCLMVKNRFIQRSPQNRHFHFFLKTERTNIRNVVSINITLLWYVTPSRLVDRYQQGLLFYFILFYSIIFFSFSPFSYSSEVFPPPPSYSILREQLFTWALLAIGLLIVPVSLPSIPTILTPYGLLFYPEDRGGRFFRNISFSHSTPVTYQKTVVLTFTVVRKCNFTHVNANITSS